jgi:hypothetical protein
MKVEGRVGTITGAVGSVNPLRTHTDGSLAVIPAGGKYAEAAIAGRLFGACTATPLNTSTTLNTTFVGLGLCNPTGSGKLLILHEFSYGFDNATATGGSILSLAGTTESGFSASVAIRCTRFGFATSVAYVMTGATIIAPVILKIIGCYGETAVTAWSNLPSIVDLGGSIVIAPGRAIVTDTTIAVGATTAQFSYMWEEIDE